MCGEDWEGAVAGGLWDICIVDTATQEENTFQYSGTFRDKIHIERHLRVRVHNLCTIWMYGKSCMRIVCVLEGKGGVEHIPDLVAEAMWK